MSSIKEVAHDKAHDHIDHMAHCLITHVPHPPGAPSLSSVLTMIPICPHFPLPICQKRCQVVKKLSSCQKDVKCQKVKYTDSGGGSQKNNKLTLRGSHIYVNFGIIYEDHQNCSKTLSMHILRVFGGHHMWCQNWHQYVWTSLCQFIFFVNLLHSPCVWLFDIWHLFDNLTFFW